MPIAVEFPSGQVGLFVTALPSPALVPALPVVVVIRCFTMLYWFAIAF